MAPQDMLEAEARINAHCEIMGIVIQKVHALFKDKLGAAHSYDDKQSVIRLAACVYNSVVKDTVIPAATAITVADEPIKIPAEKEDANQPEDATEAYYAAYDRGNYGGFEPIE